MKSIRRIGIIAMTLVLIGAWSATAHHIHETHLSSSYAPILKPAFETTNHDEQAAYIHQARVAVRTDKARESEAKLDERQTDFDSSLVMDGSPQNASSIL